MSGARSVYSVSGAAAYAGASPIAEMVALSCTLNAALFLATALAVSIDGAIS